MELKRDLQKLLVKGWPRSARVANLDRFMRRCRVIEAMDHGNGREIKGLDGIKGQAMPGGTARLVTSVRNVSDPMLHWRRTPFCRYVSSVMPHAKRPRKL